MGVGIRLTHDELNGTNEVAEELEDQVLLLLLHLVQTVSAGSGVSDGQWLRADTGAVGASRAIAEAVRALCNGGAVLAAAGLDFLLGQTCERECGQPRRPSRRERM